MEDSLSEGYMQHAPPQRCHKHKHHSLSGSTHYYKSPRQWKGEFSKHSKEFWQWHIVKNMTEVSDTVNCLGSQKALHCEDWNYLQVGKDVGHTVWRLLERGCHYHWVSDSKDRGRAGLWRFVVLINTDDGQCPNYWSSSGENVFRLLKIYTFWDVIYWRRRGVSTKKEFLNSLFTNLFVHHLLLLINKP